MTQTATDPGMRPPRFRVVPVAVALMLVVAACGGKSPAQLAQDALNAGIAAHSAGNLPEAQRQYQECLKHEVTNKICHYNLGLVAQTNGDLVTAENEYRLSLSTDPNYTPSLFNLAIVRTAAGDVTEAIALYTKYTQLKPDDAGGHLNLGLLLIQNGQADAGQKEIEAAVAIDPTIAVPQPSSTPATSPSASPSATTEVAPRRRRAQVCVSPATLSNPTWSNTRQDVRRGSGFDRFPACASSGRRADSVGRDRGAAPVGIRVMMMPRATKLLPLG